MGLTDSQRLAQDKTRVANATRPIPNVQLSDDFIVDDEASIVFRKRVELLNALTESQRHQELYFDTLVDSAILAANQVQDIQAEIAKQGAKVSGGDIFFDVLISLTLSSTIAGAILKRATSSILSRVLRTRLAFYNLPKSAVGQAAQDRIASSIVASSRKVKLTSDFLTKQKDTITNLYSDRVTEVVDDAQKLLLTAAKTAGKKKRKTVKLPQTDSPSVAIMDMAMNFARRQKTMNNIVFDALMNFINSTNVSNKLLAVLIAEFQSHIEPIHEDFDLSALRKQYKLYYEACIWTQIINWDKFGVDIVRNPSDEATISGIPPAFTQYAIHRFLVPIKSNQPIGEFKTFFEDAQGNQTVAVAKLMRYLVRIRDEVAKLSNALDTPGLQVGQYADDFIDLD